MSLNTVFKLPKQDFTEEQDIWINWTTLATIDIGAWETKPEVGIMDGNGIQQEPCQYDIQNLD